MAILGVSTIYMYPRNVINAIKEAAMMGFRHVNIFAYPPHFREDSDEFITNVKKTIFDYGLDCSIKIQGYTINLAATNPNLRRKSLDEVNYWIDIASKLNCSCVILRAGMFFYAERVFREQTIGRLVEDLTNISEKAASLGIEMYLENYPYPFDAIALPSDFLKICRLVRARVYLALNIPHLYDVYRNRRIDVMSDIKATLAWIRAIYVSDYVNPWDHPRKLTPERMEEYRSFIREAMGILKRGELGPIIVIGFNKDDVISIKKFLLDIISF